jgi:hypothetical protein
MDARVRREPAPARSAAIAAAICRLMAPSARLSPWAAAAWSPGLTGTTTVERAARSTRSSSSLDSCQRASSTALPLLSTSNRVTSTATR